MTGIIKPHDLRKSLVNAMMELLPEERKEAASGEIKWTDREVKL